MAKFCSQCGRPLKEGEICTCQSQKKEAVQEKPAPAAENPQGQPYGNGAYTQGKPQANPYGNGAYGQGNPQGQPYGNGAYGQGGPQGQPYGNGAYGQGGPQGQPYGQQGNYYGNPQGQPYGGAQPPKQPGAAGIYMKGLWGTIADAFRKPAGTLANLTVSGKTPVILGVLGVQILLFSLIFMVFGIKVNSLASRMSGGYLSYKVVSTPMLFFVALLGAAAVLACWGVFAMVFGRGMGKKPMTYMQGLGVAAAKALAQMPFTAATVLIVLIFPIVSRYSVNAVPFAIALLIYEAGNLLSYFFVPAGMDAFLSEDKNKRVWQLFFLFLVNVVITAIIVFLFGMMVGSSLANLL